MTTITLELERTSIQNAIRQLRQYKKDMDSKLAQGIADVAEAGARRAEEEYSHVRATVAPEDDADNIRTIIEDFTQSERRHIDVTTEAESKSNKMVQYIKASGSGVAFAEFGAGAYADYTHPYVSEAPFPVYAGSWSEKDKQQYTRFGKWWFATLIYYGIEPARGLYQATQRMKETAAPLIRARFRQGADT